jgi:hypothetical protein
MKYLFILLERKRMDYFNFIYFIYYSNGRVKTGSLVSLLKQGTPRTPNEWLGGIGFVGVMLSNAEMSDKTNK